MLPDEVREAVERIDSLMKFAGSENGSDWQTIRAHLLAREAEVERLQAIEKERWDVVATRNASVMRAERAEALLRECLDCLPIHPATHARITAHLSENTHDA
jgi:DNA recombination-dependent growth factor C